MSLAGWVLLRPSGAAASAQERQAMPASPLMHRVIVVDAGHGLPDAGCVGVNGTLEYVLNLEIARKTRDLLEGAGATVVMTRQDDYALHPRDMPRGNRKREDFAQRKAIIEAAGAELVISIHMNEYPNARASGSQVFFQQDDEAGKELAQLLQATLCAQCEGARTSVSHGDFFMLRLGVPGVLVECGFLSNPDEEKLLGTQAHQQQLALAIAEGVAAWCAAHPQVQGPIFES